VLRNQRHGGDSRKFADQMADDLHLLRSAPMDRHEDRIHWAFTDDPHGIGNGVPM
jgi:hypothetical protein